MDAIIDTPYSRTRRAAKGGALGRLLSRWGDMLRARAGSIDGRSKLTPRVMFAAVLIGYPVFVMIAQPQWVFSGAMWAETATNYYPNSVSGSPWSALFATDAGYSPVFLRILALLPVAFGTSATAIPYVYTAIALLGAAVLVGSFCLPWFRLIIASDATRLVVVALILFVADFSTRTFINISYFAVVPIAACAVSAALADRPVPWWMFLLPILALTKPTVLAAIPLVVLALLFAGRRFRVIGVIIIAAAFAQVAQLAVSSLSGYALGPSTDWTTVDKAITAAKAGAALPGSLVLGPGHLTSFVVAAMCGILVAGGVVALLILTRRPGTVLAVAGLVLIVGNAAISAFGLSFWWNRGTVDSVISDVPISRQTIVAYIGAVFVVAGVVSALLDSVRDRLEAGSTWYRVLAVLGAPIVLVWFVTSGWYARGIELLPAPAWPTTGNSAWESHADQIDRGEPVCFPVDPVGWGYTRGCHLGDGSAYSPAVFSETPVSEIEFTLPAASAARLAALTVYAAPAGGTTGSVTASADIQSARAGSTILTATSDLPADGGSLTFTTSPAARAALGASEGLVSVHVTFGVPVRIAYLTGEPTQPAMMVWVMGD